MCERAGSVQEISVPSSQIYFDAKTALKKNRLLFFFKDAYLQCKSSNKKAEHFLAQLQLKICASGNLNSLPLYTYTNDQGSVENINFVVTSKF